MPDLTQSRLDHESAWALLTLEALPENAARRLERLKDLTRKKRDYTIQTRSAKNRVLDNLMKRELAGPHPGHPLWHELNNPVRPETNPHRGTRTRGN